MSKESKIEKKKIRIRVSQSIGSVSAEVLLPDKTRFIIVLAHGAGAGMMHPFMERLGLALAQQGIGSIRYNFPFTENAKGRPDPPAIAQKTIEAALDKAHQLFPKAGIIAAGKSFGGRMSSHFLAKNFPDYVGGLIFYGFPLHAPGKPGVERADHLKEVKVPMLFLQGTRDTLAKIELITSVARKLKGATLVKYEGGDHSFKSGKKDFVDELADDTSKWLKRL